MKERNQLLYIIPVVYIHQVTQVTQDRVAVHKHCTFTVLLMTYV